MRKMNTASKEEMNQLIAAAERFDALPELPTPVALAAIEKSAFALLCDRPVSEQTALFTSLTMLVHDLRLRVASLEASRLMAPRKKLKAPK